MRRPRYLDRFDEAWRLIVLRLSWTGHPELTSLEMTLVLDLPAGEARTIAWIAEHLRVPLSMCLEQVRSLERRGYLARSRDPGDRRRNAVRLAPLGEQVVADYRVFDPDSLSEALDDLEAPDRQVLIVLLERLAQAATSVARRRGREDPSGFAPERRAIPSPRAQAAARAGAAAIAARVNGWGRLTPAERQVAALVSQGLTNIQVADRLLVQRRTVESHLHNVYVKLGISTRTQLAHLVSGPH